MINWPASLEAYDDDWSNWSEENCIARAYVLEMMREELTADYVREVMNKVLAGEILGDGDLLPKRVLVEEMEEGARSVGVTDEQLVLAVKFCELELCEDEATGQLFFRNGLDSFMDLTEEDEDERTD